MTYWALTNPWDPEDPNRGCFTCGAPPDGRYFDGSPAYRGCYGKHPRPVYPEDLPPGWQPTTGTRPTVTLTEREYARAVARAERIVAMDKARGWQVKFDPGSEGRLAINIRGFGAELAAARATGLALNWGRLLPRGYRRRDKPADLGARTEVRNARRATGFLWADKDVDPMSRLYLLVTGTERVYQVAGWAEGRDLMQPANWREPPAVKYPGYFLEQADLRGLPLPDDA